MVVMLAIQHFTSFVLPRLVLVSVIILVLKTSSSLICCVLMIIFCRLCLIPVWIGQRFKIINLQGVVSMKKSRPYGSSRGGVRL